MAFKTHINLTLPKTNIKDFFPTKKSTHVKVLRSEQNFLKKEVYYCSESFNNTKNENVKISFIHINAFNFFR